MGLGQGATDGVMAFWLLLMVREAFTDLARPPHAATCSSVGGGVRAICGGGGGFGQGFLNSKDCCF